MDNNINKNEYPFQSKWLKVNKDKLHYIDQGSGDVILFVHGTPGWSFEWRKVIKELSKTNRCIAIDNLGFGLSDKPINGDYSCKAHSMRLIEAIKFLNLEKFDLVVHDFGGQFGLGMAVECPEKINRIFVMNTWLGSIKNIKAIKQGYNIMSGAMGRFLYLNMNFSVNFMLPNSYYNKKNISKEIHKNFSERFPTKDSRQSTFKLVKELVEGSEFYDSILNGVKTKLKDKNWTIIWGMDDKFIKHSDMIQSWKDNLPNAKYIELRECGHYPHEEQPEAIINAIKK